MRILLMVSVAATAMLFNQPAKAGDDSATIIEAITKGKAKLSFRLRNENVDQDGFADSANALTLRSRLKYTTGTYKGFSGVVEVENVYALDNSYNSTINGRTNKPVIADPKSTEINQAYLAYTGIEGATLLAGRVALNLDNQRFVGTVGWRQNDQTYDMVGAILKPMDKFTLTAGYVWNVNRIFSDDHPFGNLDTDSFVINGKYSGLGFGNLTAYGLFIDLNNPAVYGLSSQTIGVRFDGSTEISDNMKLIYEAEYATQSDYKDNPLSFNANYYHLMGGVKAGGITAKIGYEVLGSDNGTASFQTPLATLHKFNGWADKFLSTPTNGLTDFYVSAAYKFGSESALKGLNLAAIYHDFNSDFGGIDYGSEINLVANKKFGKNYYGQLKYADYSADTLATDTRKIWVTIGANF